ncbi:MAG: hypothetical protein UX68_C0020G0005 [Parcubacteria group bacterium GW2011_GWA2_46_9]|nr:MAG: hypothetical protein UX68_C0020G0005 [Parcubacteria group bacterium GW2011_GWA2_46_9]OGL85351.1 MAG: hypothetical protein A3I37_00730 [Candidatus Uhrbacteria bacterium RIFCSPLOWO2_02_FULL_46_19]
MGIPTIKKPAMKLATAILEVNEVSFRFYVFGLAGLLIANKLTKGWLMDTGLLIGPLYAFVGISAILKFLYHIDGIRLWLREKRSDFRGGKLLIRILVRLIIKADTVVGFFKERILNGQTLVQRLSVLSRTVFSWFLILYLCLLVIEEFKTNWALINLQLKLNTLFVWLIFAGIVSVSLNVQKGGTITQLQENNSRQHIGWREWGIIGILTAGAGLIVYWKVGAMGWTGLAVAILSALLVLLISILIMVDNYYVRED